MGDSTALAGAMQQLIDDAPLRERMGQAAGERSKIFRAENSVPQFEAAYRQMVS
jgi:glycosyltransferase involved in cell wall biosynthesis